MSATIPPTVPRRVSPIAPWVIIVGTIAALVVLFAVWNVLGQARPSGGDIVVSDALAAADVAEQHGQAMMAFGARLSNPTGDVAGQPEAQTVAGYGAHWRADGQAMVQLAADIRRALATNPPRPGSASTVELDRLQGQALMLQVRGQALAEHGQVMRELTAALQLQVGGSNYPWVRDSLAEMQRQSDGMATVGKRLVAAGDRLHDSVEQLNRSLAR